MDTRHQRPKTVAQNQAVAREPEAPSRLSVAPGDHLYFHHGAGPACGKVLACGKHGATIESEGKRHRVKWDKMLGHKERVNPKMRVVEHGGDGMLLEDSKGRRHFLRGELPEEEEPMKQEPAPSRAKTIVDEMERKPLTKAFFFPARPRKPKTVFYLPIKASGRAPVAD